MLATSLGPIGQISRTVKDIESAEAFYRDVLKIPHLYRFGTLSFFDCGGVRLFLSQSEGTTSDSLIYFSVADIQVAYTELTSRGVDFIGAPHMIHRHSDGTEEWMAFFKDDEGRPLAIMAKVAA